MPSSRAHKEQKHTGLPHPLHPGMKKTQAISKVTAAREQKMLHAHAGSTKEHDRVVKEVSTMHNASKGV